MPKPQMDWLTLEIGGVDLDWLLDPGSGLTIHHLPNAVANKISKVLQAHIETIERGAKIAEVEETDAHWAKWSDSDHPNWQAWEDYVNHRIKALKKGEK